MQAHILDKITFKCLLLTWICYLGNILKMHNIFLIIFNSDLLKCTHLQVIHDVEKFICSSEQIWGNLALQHLLQWMGAIRMRADKNIIIIYTTPVHQLTSCEVKNYMFIINKSTIKVF